MFKKKGFKKFLILFIISLLLSQYLPYIVVKAQQENPQDEKIKKYLLNNERIVSKQELSFGKGPNKITLTIYELSSGKFLVYSNKHDAVVLGDEWMGIEDGEELALQLLSLYAYDLYKPLDDFRPEAYDELYDYWNKGSEIAKNYFLGRRMDIAILKLAAGVAVAVIMAPVTGGVSFAVFLLGYGADLAYKLLEDLPKNLKIDEENSPRLFLVLSMMPSDETGYEMFQESLNKLKNVGFSSLLSKINVGIKTITTLWGMKDIFGLTFMEFYTFAAKNPSLLQKLEGMFSKEIIEKAGTFFIFGGNKGSFKEFSDVVRNCWNKVPGSASKLSDILIKNAIGTLGSMALDLVIDIAVNYIISASKDINSLMGFHGAHSILIRDLSRGLSNELIRLQREERLPTLENIQIFLWYNYLLYYGLLSEYDESISKLDMSTLYNAPHDLIKFWGFSPPSWWSSGTTTETWAAEIKGWFSFLKSLMEQEADNTLAKALEYTLNVFKIFDEYRQDMARRRSAPSPTAGINLFLVTDVSGSMGSNFRGTRKIDAAKKGAIDLISLTSKQDNIGLVKFSTTAELINDLTTDKKTIIDKIREMQPEDATALGDGIWLAVERLENALRKNKKPCAIVVLTDGMHNAGIHSPKEAALKAKSLNIPVYTLGYGEKGDINENTLIEIAQITGAQYYYAPSPEDLRKVYISLSQQISGGITEKSLVQTIKEGEEQITPVNVSPGTAYLSVKASYGGSKINVILQKPNGLNITGTEGNVVYKEEPGYISYVVYYPDPGEWKIRTIGIETPKEGEEYRLAVAKPGLTVEPKEINVILRPEESTKVSVRVKALRPLSSIEILKLGAFEFIDVNQSSFSNIQENQEVSFNVILKAPDLSKGSFFRGLIGIRAIDSLVFLPITIRLSKLLIPITLVNASCLYEKESLDLTIRVIDENGNAVTRASVEAILDGIRRNLTEFEEGFYKVNLTSLPLGEKIIIINISKLGYTSTNISFSIFVAIIGDINKDGTVDYKDLALLIKSYGLPIHHIEVVAGTDLNKDWRIDYKDLAILIGNYGRSIP
jgi:Mg-chelatase subunit ChlD